MSRKAWTAAMVGTGAVLASVLVMCGPGAGDDVSVAALPDASPSASDTAARLLPVSPSPATPAPSPLPPPTPGVAVPVDGPDTAAAAPSAGAGATADAAHASASARPKPGHSPHAPAPAHGPSAAPTPAGAGAGGRSTICDQAERAGHWPAGSESARLCRSIYG
ncbi:hypothetical protein ACFWP2_11760 [Kitasatospora sp. NPDC058444]|uniref:hypothetical protein n=1 Tax=Kitasatospora sp. NPDC058444 TaxID=3346504 RepID=UPI00365A77B6